MSVSNRHDGSVTNGPRTPRRPVDRRRIAEEACSGRPRRSAAGPSVSNTRITSFTVSITKPFPTQRPWSGGSTENWLPPLARRWSRWFSPSKLATNSGFDFAFLALLADPPFPLPPEFARSTSGPTPGVGSPSLSCPANSGNSDCPRAEGRRDQLTAAAGGDQPRSPGRTGELRT